MERLATAAQAAGVGVHCDSLQPSTQDAAIELASSPPAARVTFSRWRRSATDAVLAIDAGLRVRVVKGQGPDSFRRTASSVARS